jgi:hypothetical protein
MWEGGCEMSEHTIRKILAAISLIAGIVGMVEFGMFFYIVTTRDINMVWAIVCLIGIMGVYTASILAGAVFVEQLKYFDMDGDVK